MSCHIITQHKAKKGRSEELIALVRHSLSESMLHGGALTVSYQQNQDDPDDLISDQYWETRKHYEDYFKWRADNGSGAKFQDLCAEIGFLMWFQNLPTRARRIKRRLATLLFNTKQRMVVPRTSLS